MAALMAASQPHIYQTSQDPCRKKDLASKKEERWKSSNTSRRSLIRPLNHCSINQSLKLTFMNYKLQKLGGSIFWKLPYSSNTRKQILTTLLRCPQKLLLSNPSTVVVKCSVMQLLHMPTFFFPNSSIERSFICHTIHQFKVYVLVIWGICRVVQPKHNKF